MKILLAVTHLPRQKLSPVFLCLKYPLFNLCLAAYLCLHQSIVLPAVTDTYFSLKQILYGNSPPLTTHPAHAKRVFAELLTTPPFLSYFFHLRTLRSSERISRYAFLLRRHCSGLPASRRVAGAIMIFFAAVEKDRTKSTGPLVPCALHLVHNPERKKTPDICTIIPPRHYDTLF